jgi:hypothetical protein
MDPDQRRLVATMPLHAITSTYGEEGLRERFAVEIASLPDEDQRRLNQALDLAARLHAADRREREPYINHLLRVAIRIMSHYGVRDTDVICAALLHDAVEDHPAELAASFPGAADFPGAAGAGGGAQAGPGEDPQAAPGEDPQAAPGEDRRAALAALAAEFGPRVADLVSAVTNPQYAPDRDTNEQYREHVADSLRRNPWARVIKASDFTDNGVGLIHSTGPRIRRLAGKYAPLVPILRELIDLPDTPLSAPARQLILTQLDRAADRFAAVLPSDEGLPSLEPGRASFRAGTLSFGAVTARPARLVGLHQLAVRLVQRLLGVGQGERGQGRELAGPGERGVAVACPAGEAAAQRAVGVDGVAADQDRLGGAGAAQRGQTADGPRVHREAEARRGDREGRRGRRDAQVTGDRELRARADRRTVDGGKHRHARLGDGGEHRVKRVPERLVVGGAQVGAGAEGRARAGDDDGTGAFGGLLAHRLAQRVAVRRVQGVAALMAVDLDDGDVAVAALADHDIS